MTNIFWRLAYVYRFWWRGYIGVIPVRAAWEWSADRGYWDDMSASDAADDTISCLSD